MKLTKKGKAADLADLEHAAQAEELVENFEDEHLRLCREYVDAKRALETGHQVALALLEKRKLVALAKLWRRQGRVLGPGMLRQLGEINGWNGGTNGQTR